MILRADTPEALESLAAPLLAAGYVAAGRWVRVEFGSGAEYIQAYRKGETMSQEQLPDATETRIQPGESGYFEPDGEDDICAALAEHHFCTQARGHEGDHASHGGGIVQQATWPRVAP